uniref:Secreted protein n=1 Tax=Mycena chlorophos TaxID=658473 RepID=A0ABQ0LNG6_MYCCL|nr:predicted protein [Mycena chlorophos]
MYNRDFSSPLTLAAFLPLSARLQPEATQRSSCIELQQQHYRSSTEGTVNEPSLLWVIRVCGASQKSYVEKARQPARIPNSGALKVISRLRTLAYTTSRLPLVCSTYQKRVNFRRDRTLTDNTQARAKRHRRSTRRKPANNASSSPCLPAGTLLAHCGTTDVNLEFSLCSNLVDQPSPRSWWLHSYWARVKRALASSENGEGLPC